MNLDRPIPELLVDYSRLTADTWRITDQLHAIRNKLDEHCRLATLQLRKEIRRIIRKSGWHLVTAHFRAHILHGTDPVTHTVTGFVELVWAPGDVLGGTHQFKFDMDNWAQAVERIAELVRNTRNMHSNPNPKG